MFFWLQFSFLSAFVKKFLMQPLPRGDASPKSGAEYYYYKDACLKTTLGE